MTDFTDEKPTPRQPRLNPQNEHFDFDLAEMHVLPDNDVPPPAPLENITDDQDAIDRVLVDAGFSQHQNDIVPNRFISEETLLPPKPPEIKTSFYVDYFDKRKKNKAKQTNAQETTENQTMAEQHQTVEQTSVPNPEPVQAIESTPAMMDTETSHQEPSFINGSGMAVAVLSQFKSKQESINKQQEKLIQDFSKKIKKATTATYAAMFFGIAALATAATLSMMLFQTKTKLSDLETANTALKDEIRNIKTMPNEIEGVDPSLDQITQKIDNVEEQLSDMAELQNKVALLEKNVLARPAPTVLPVNKPTEPVETHTTEPETATKTKPAKTTNTPTPVVTKPTTPTKPVATTKTPTTAEPNKAQNTAKPNPVAKKDDIMEKAIAVPANDINKVANHGTNNANNAQSAKTATPAQTAKPSSSSGWTVNLASSNRLEDANRTAATFQQKGVPVIVSPVTIKNETRYRLQVKGFKTKEEAAAYANKAKAALNLNSVWINP